MHFDSGLKDKTKRHHNSLDNCQTILYCFFAYLICMRGGVLFGLYY